MLVLIRLSPAGRAAVEAAWRKIEGDPFGRDAWGAPQGGDAFEQAERDAGLLVRLAPGGRLRRLALVDQAGGRFHELRVGALVERRRPELADEQHAAPLRVVGKHGDGVAMVLDLARNHRPVVQAHPRDHEGGEALVKRPDVEDFGGAVIRHRERLPAEIERDWLRRRATARGTTATPAHRCPCARARGFRAWGSGRAVPWP